jgi:glutaredoxin 3
MKILIIGGEGCRYCVLAKQLLEKQEMPFTYLDVRTDDTYENKTGMEYVADVKQRTIPQVFIDNSHIGGYTELYSYINDLNKLTGA